MKYPEVKSFEIAYSLTNLVDITAVYP